MQVCTGIYGELIEANKMLLEDAGLMSSEVRCLALAHPALVITAFCNRILLDRI